MTEEEESMLDVTSTRKQQQTATATRRADEGSLCPEEMLKVVVALLGASNVDGKDVIEPQTSALLSSSLPLSSSSKKRIPNEFVQFWKGEFLTTTTNPDVEISSFPSLSLKHSSRKTAKHHQAAVERHIAKLLSRPILVGKDDDDDDDQNDNPTNCLVVKDFVQIPNIMLHNFYTSFCTLVDARLRAYAKFLTNHGLLLVLNPEDLVWDDDDDNDNDNVNTTMEQQQQQQLDDDDDDDDDNDDEQQQQQPHTTNSTSSVVHVGQKLENLISIGNHVSADAIVTSFIITSDKSIKQQRGGGGGGKPGNANQNNATSSTTTTATEEFCIIMPLVMEVFIDISFPTTTNTTDETTTDCENNNKDSTTNNNNRTTTTVAFRANGNIQGTFSKQNKNGKLHLCAIDVELDTKQLLSCMTKQATNIVSMIAEMANTVTKRTGGHVAAATATATATPAATEDTNVAISEDRRRTSAAETMDPVTTTTTTTSNNATNANIGNDITSPLEEKNSKKPSRRLSIQRALSFAQTNFIDNDQDTATADTTTTACTNKFPLVSPDLPTKDTNGNVDDTTNNNTNNKNIIDNSNNDQCQNHYRHPYHHPIEDDDDDDDDDEDDDTYDNVTSNKKQQEDVELSTENCESIVDVVFGQVDCNMLLNSDSNNNNDDDDDTTDYNHKIHSDDPNNGGSSNSSGSDNDKNDTYPPKPKRCKYYNNNHNYENVYF